MFVGGDSVESVILYRQKGKSRVSKFVLAILGLTIIAVGVSFAGNADSQKKVEKIWERAFNDFGTTLSLQTVESYAPNLQYGLYAATGKEKFPNWEQELLYGKLEKKQNTLVKLVEELSKEAADENIQEASVLDHTLIIDKALEENNESTEVGIIYGENYFEKEQNEVENSQVLAQNKKMISNLKKTLSLDYLIKNFYIVDSTTSINKSVFNVEKLLKKKCTMKLNPDKPQILIYHTHGGSEAFVDSDGSKKDSVVGTGAELARILTEEYGYNVIHDETCYDIINGRIERSKGYDKSLSGVKKTLKKYPSIEVVIDLHRDSASQHQKRVTTINGKKTAKIMFFNGLSRKASGENISYLKNPNLQGNLAFSLQLEMKAMELYPDFMTKIYLKGYRYNLHLREKSLLIELGTDLNTVQEAKNAMEPLAEVLNEVLNE